MSIPNNPSPFAYPVKTRHVVGDGAVSYLMDAVGRDIASGEHEDIAAITDALNELEGVREDAAKDAAMRAALSPAREEGT